MSLTDLLRFLIGAGSVLIEEAAVEHRIWVVGDNEELIREIVIPVHAHE